MAAAASLFGAVRRGDAAAVRALLFPGEAGGEDELPPLSSSLPSGGSLGGNPSRWINAADAAAQRTPLHAAVAAGHAHIAALLLRHPQTNPAPKDGESGWTPMHRAVYAGDVGMAMLLARHRGANPTERDKEGNSWADLLNSTYEGSKPRSSKAKASSNTQPASKRQIPTGQRLLPPSTKFLAPSAQTTPNHSDDSDSGDEDASDDEPEFASLSSSPPRNGKPRRPRPGADTDVPAAHSLWTWGANHNFVLAHGTPDSRQFPERVQDLPAGVPCSLESLDSHLPAVRDARMSKYHACAVLADGRLFVWGFGSSGRLGLGPEVAGPVLRPALLADGVRTAALGTDHTLVVTVSGALLSCGANAAGQLGYPTEVRGDAVQPEWRLKEVMRRGVVGCASGKEHSVCWTDSGAVFTWGKNGGMLGHHNLPPNAIVATPRKLASFHSPQVLQIVCTSSATAILHAPTPHERAVLVLSNGEHHRVSFPVAPSFPRHMRHYTSSSQLEQQRRHGTARQHRIARLAAGNHQFAALTSAGEVFLWTPPQEGFENTWVHQTFPQAKPKRIWAVRNRAWLAARDVAVGIDGAIAVATRSGHVFAGTRRDKAKQRPAADRGAGETDVVYFKYRQVPLLQHATRVVASASGGFGALRVDERPGGRANGEAGRLRRELGRLVDEAGDGDIAPDVVIEVEGLKGTEEIGAHRCILAARSSYLRGLFERAGGLPVGGKLDGEGGVTVERLLQDNSEEDRPALRVAIAGVYSQSVVPLLQLAYSASFSKTWDHTAFSPEGRQRKGGASKGPTAATVYADFRRLVRQFGLGDPDVAQFSQEQDRLSREHSQAIMSLVDVSAAAKRPSVLPDTVLRLADRDVECHRAILVARCPFFHAMLGSGPRWALQRDERGRVVVMLEHLRWEVVRILLAWMYGDGGAAELFADVRTPSVGSFSAFLVEVLAAATELLLTQLKDVCGSILVRTLDLRNVRQLLETADTYDAEGLKHACLDFVCWNLESAIETGMLEGMEPDLVEDVSVRLREMQAAKYPFIRGEDGYYAQIKREAARVEEERKQRRRVDFGERKKLEELSRSLDDSTINQLIANGAFDPQPAAEPEGGSSDDERLDKPGRMPRSSSGRNDDDIFELEMEDGQGREAQAQASPWAKSAPTAAPARLLSSPPPKASANKVDGGAGSKRAPKAAWKKVDLTTGKVVEDEPPAAPEAAKGGLVGGSTQTSPAPPKTWSIPVVAKPQRTSLLDIMSETQSKSSKAPSRAPSLSSSPAAPLPPAPRNVTPPSVSGTAPRAVRSSTWTSTSSTSNPTSPMASPPPSAILSQLAQQGGPPSMATLSLGSTAAFVTSSGSQKDRRKSARNAAGGSPVLGPTAAAAPKAWKGWAPIEVPPPAPLATSPPRPPSPTTLAARLREFPAISGSSKEAPGREKVW